MTTAIENRRNEDVTSTYTDPISKSHSWLADQLPKVAVGFGIAVTVAWIAALAWASTYMLHVF